jgi:pre-mRNA-splicing factor ATP-dependent RNA helicase DHX38/PRP16
MADSYPEFVPKRRRLDNGGYSSSRGSTPKFDGNRYGERDWDRRSTPKQNEFDRETEPKDDPEESLALDRDWYGGDEYGHTVGDDFHNPFGGADGTWLDAESERKLAEQKTTRRKNQAYLQKQREVDAWEANRMLTSGVAQRRHDVRIDPDDENEGTRVHIIVHELKPPFLDGRTIFTKQQESIPIWRDANSDMAIFSRKGSKVVKERRQNREREQQARERTSIRGTALGNLMGIKDEDTDSAVAKDDVTNGVVKKEPERGNETANTAQSHFSRSKSIKEQKESLPAFAKREEFLHTIRENQCLIVIGETGSGKSTQLTQYLHEAGYGERGMIACTQPRRVAAHSVARRVAEEMGVKLGELVGYTIRFEDVTGPLTKVRYMTDGVLLRESISDPDLSRYSVIILDEAHERSLNTDVLMSLLKRVLAKRRDLKIIVTSATMSSEKFSAFYGGAPTFFIPGRTFEVQKLYSKSPHEDFVQGAVNQILSIHVSQPAGDILVFMTGQEDIVVTCELVEEKLKVLKDPAPLLILPIYSQLPADLQSKIFEPAPKGTRKVIVATNIAETSLTVDGIVYVVDTGYAKIKSYNSKLGMDALQPAPISQANALQRAGRAGRTGPGKCYFLYTERAFRDEMYISQIPEIQRTNLSNTILLLKSLGVKDLVNDFDLMDSPPQDTIVTAMYDLWALGALDNLGNLTELGKSMTPFPMEPSLAKCIVASVDAGCSEEMLTIVSMLSVPNVFYRPQERMEEADAAREKFLVAESDHLSLLNVFNQFRKHPTSSWCAKHFLHHKSLMRAAEVRAQLEDILRSLKLNIQSSGMNWDIVRKVICSGFYHNAARRTGLGQYQNLRTSVGMKLPATSSLYGHGVLPDYVVYHELVLTAKEPIMSAVSSVDPRWLAEDGGVFYALKEKTYSTKDRRVIETEYNRKAELEAQMARDKAIDDAAKAAETESARPAVVKPVKKAAAIKVSESGVVKKPVVVRRRGF